MPIFLFSSNSFTHSLARSLIRTKSAVRKGVRRCSGDNLREGSWLFNKAISPHAIDTNATATIIIIVAMFPFCKYTPSHNAYTTHSYALLELWHLPHSFKIRINNMCACVCMHAAYFSLRESNDRTISLRLRVHTMT